MKLTEPQVAAMTLARDEQLRQVVVVHSGKSTTRYARRNGMGEYVSPRVVRKLVEEKLAKIQAPPFPQGFRPTLVVLTDAGREKLAEVTS